MVDNASSAGHSARLATDRATAQRLADFLTENLDEQEVAVAAFEGSGGAWNTAIYFSAPPNETALRALVALEVGADLANALIFERIETKDWVAASLEGLAPVRAGRFIVHGRHDRARLRANDLGIEIEAALAFGTGHHGTTRGCLLALDWLAKQTKKKTNKTTPSPTLLLAGGGRKMRRRRNESFLPLKGGGSRRGSMRILDIGTGTGVLAIGAAKALRRHVLASDIDRRAVAVAHDNARLNQVAPSIAFIHAAGIGAHAFRTHGPFDLVLANILLGPLTRLARPMRQLLKPGAYVVLSGLLTSHAQTALVAYRDQGLVLLRRIMLDEWTTLVLRKPTLPR